MPRRRQRQLDFVVMQELVHSKQLRRVAANRPQSAAIRHRDLPLPDWLANVVKARPSPLPKNCIPERVAVVLDMNLPLGGNCKFSPVQTVSARRAEWLAQAEACFEAHSGCWGVVERHRIRWNFLSLGAAGAFATPRLLLLNQQAFAYPTFAHTQNLISRFESPT